MSIAKDHGIHVKVFSDSTTAIACINELDTSHSELCYHIAKQIWEWAQKIYIYIYIYITGAQVIDHKNINADRESRESSYDLKWMLCPKSLKSCPEIHPRDRHVCKQYKFHIYFLCISIIYIYQEFGNRWMPIERISLWTVRVINEC